MQQQLLPNLEDYVGLCDNICLQICGRWDLGQPYEQSQN